MSNRQYSGAYSRRRYSNYSAAAAKNAATGSATFGTASDNDDPQAMCTLRVSCIASMGRVTASGMQDGQVTVRKGSQVTLEATPRDGYRFVRWDIASRLPAGTDTTANPITLTVNGNTTVTAVFAKTESPLIDYPEIKPDGPAPAPVTIITSAASDPVATAIALAKKYWWALLIVGYIIYDSRKGGQK